jgi:N-acetylglutamate synthase-like GNAT family acetyltransferase
MTLQNALEIAALLNEQNQLSRKYDAKHVIDNCENYIFRTDKNRKTVGVVECNRVQWYQWEIKHLSVAVKRQGIGALLLDEATAKAESLGARILQCTIRLGNAESEAFFTKHGFSPSVSFINYRTGNRVTVFQKSLKP